MNSRGDQAEKLIETWANDEDREYAARKKNPDAARNSLLARAVLRNGSVKGKILIGENGKPYIKNGPHISISHSKDMVACAWCEDFAVGIDVEYWQEREFKKLAAKAFGSGEQVNDIAGFYRIWTMREAIAKVGGESVFAGMNSDVDLKKWKVVYEVPEINYSLAIAAEKDIIVKQILIGE